VDRSDTPRAAICSFASSSSFGQTIFIGASSWKTAIDYALSLLLFSL
jgi:hypothetical protein